LLKRKLPLPQPRFLSKQSFLRLRHSPLLDISNWWDVWDVTLTLKQARQTDDRKLWIRADEYQCQRAFRHFMNPLNRTVFGKAFYRHGKSLSVIPVLEKETHGRWHYHAAIEPPKHIAAEYFKQLIRDCWDRTDWAHHRILVRENADRGWVNYLLKPSQKSDFEVWSDCIDWESLNNNPVAGA
jgi:hypothetical protein